MRTGATNQVVSQVRMRYTCQHSEADPKGGARGHAPRSLEIFSKVRFLMNLDSVIDLSNETITLIMPCILFIHSQSELSVMYILAAL